jgi:hypothetical protein
MDRAFADAVILSALKRDPEHLSEVITNVVRDLESDGRYSAEDIRAAINELLSEMAAHLQAQH